MSARLSPVGAAAAPLLYWLLVVCGLAGVTVMHTAEQPDKVVAIWLGTVVGSAVGQLVARLRLRLWLIAVLTMSTFWFGQIFFFVLSPLSGSAADTCVLTLIAAAVCGYLSLSERGTLVSFWYPAVLWMLVILDGPRERREALPFLVGLAVLFVAFLHASETRRVALWRAHASTRLATPKARTVLHASPLRAASQVGLTALVGVTALVLAAWIAPHLWQKEKAARASAPLPPDATAAQAQGDERCCPDRAAEQETRVREYLPLLGSRAEGSHSAREKSCTVCRHGQPVVAGGYESEGFGVGYGGSQVSSAGEDVAGGAYATQGAGTPYAAQGSDATSPTYGTTTTLTTPTPTTATPATPPSGPTVATSSAKAMPTVASAAAARTAAPTAKATASPAVPAIATAAPGPAAAPAPAPVEPAQGRPVAFVPTHPARAPDARAPWKSTLALCLGALALHLGIRAARRHLTLRHLVRPFWAETLDQRVSNHWQRVLIGLRDAGICASLDERPQALADRVGIDGMTTCATILERVRHGVRVDAGDLEAMASASGVAYRAARERAGVLGRAAAWLRWPLA